MKKTIDTLETLFGDPSKGLPDEMFLFISRLTPLINVDLLIKNEKHQTLLTWREDECHPPGWHIPGGIIRYKETITERINAVAAGELAAEVKFKSVPLALNEVILPSMKNRAHGISLLYECALISLPAEYLRYEKGAPQKGQWAWHGKCPCDLLCVHGMYRQFC